MRLRNVTLLLGCLAAGGAGMWLYASGTHGVGVGASGLPLIKADMTPVKIPPDNAENDVIPNADSTVFSAMGETAAVVDPSMENIAPPQPDMTAQPAEAAKTAGFAGFRTGFSLPKPAPVKTESLFASDPALAKDSKYVTGLDSPALPEETATVGAPRPIATESGKPVAVKPPQNIVAATDTPENSEPEAAPPEPAPLTEPAPAKTPETSTVVTGQTAQEMEAQEKTLARPSVKPPVPPETKPAKPEAKQPETKAVEKAQTAKLAVPKPVEAAKPAPLTTPATVAANGGSYYIQLSSVPKGGDSARKWAQLQSMYPDALRGLGPSYQPVTIPGKGEYVRIQAGPVTSQGDANKRCNALRAEDPSGGCLVIRR